MENGRMNTYVCLLALPWTYVSENVFKEESTFYSGDRVIGAQQLSFCNININMIRDAIQWDTSIQNLQDDCNESVGYSKKLLEFNIKFTAIL